MGIEQFQLRQFFRVGRFLNETVSEAGQRLNQTWKAP
jgi:hypothetical protein